MNDHSTNKVNKGSPFLRSLSLTGFFVQPYKSKVLKALVLIVMASAFEYISIAILYNTINEISGRPVSASEYGNLFRFLNTIISFLPLTNLLVASALTLLSALLFRSFFNFYANYYIEKLSQSIRMDLQVAMIRRYLAAECAFFSDSKQGALIYNALQAPATVSAMISLLAQTGMSVVMAVFLIALLFSISVKITFLLSVVSLVCAIVIGFISKKIAYAQGRRANRALSALNVIANETITCIRVIKSYCIQGKVADEFGEYSSTFLDSKLKLVVYRNLVTEVTTTGLIALFVGFMIQQSMSGVTSFLAFLPSLSVYLLSLLRLAAILSDLGKRTLDYANYLPNMDLLHNELTSHETTSIDTGHISIQNVDQIEFKNVDFGYGEKQVLDGVSFKINKNQTVAFVGPSGRGKTSLISLMLKLYRPDKGGIFINGINLNDVTTESLLKIVAPVFQTPLLFNQSVAQNIALVEDSQIDRVQLGKSLDLAHASEFVSKLQKGVDTELGDMGDRVSVGQKQRLLLARAFYKDPQFILFDEPTSALDAFSEKMIVDSIRKFKGKKTLLIVAHRLSTIQDADLIFFLRDGHIVESGSHKDLMELQGQYWNMYKESPSSVKEELAG